MRKTNESGIRKIQQSRGSYYITLPIEIVRGLGWRERQKVLVKKIRGGVQIKDWKK